MPAFDRIVEIGPPSEANYTAALATLEAVPYQINDGDNISQIDIPGEFAYANANAAGLIGWYDPTDNSYYSIERSRFDAATRILLVAPGGSGTPGTLPVGMQLTGGRVTLFTSYLGASFRPVFRHAITAGELTGGRYEYALGSFEWLSSATPFRNPNILENIRYSLRFEFDVVKTKHWARLIDSSVVDDVDLALPSVTETRRYAMRYAETTPFQELTDGGAWDIIGVEPQGRRRTMELSVQRTSVDEQTRIEL